MGNLLVRLALLLLSANESSSTGALAKDEESSLQQQCALVLLARAALVWPQCNFKVRHTCWGAGDL